MSEEPKTILPHVITPHARPVQPMPVQKEGKQFVALRDPSMLIQQTMVVQPQALGVIQLFDGELSSTEIAARIVAEETPERDSVLIQAKDQIEKLAEQMDQFGLLWGPTFDGYEKQMAENLHKAGAFPIQASASLVQLAHQAQGGDSKPPEDVEAQKVWGKELAVGMLEGWLQSAEDPEFDSMLSEKAGKALAELKVCKALVVLGRGNSSHANCGPKEGKEDSGSLVSGSGLPKEDSGSLISRCDPPDESRMRDDIAMF